MDKKQTKIGFIGLGVMGKPMSKNLLKAGYRLMVYDLNSNAVNEVVKLGAESGSSPCQVAKGGGIVITMLQLSMLRMVIAQKRVLEGAKPGLLLLI